MTKEKGKKTQTFSLYTDRFYDSTVKHSSGSLNDIHDPILQEVPHFLVQSQHIIFWLLWECKAK